MSFRLFLAIPVRLYHYEEIQDEFNPLLQGKWRDATTLHVTLAFLGNRFDPRVLLSSLEGIQWSFSISEFERFDYFQHSRVFVATTYNPSLQQVRRQLETRLSLPQETLHPHVTMMRVKTIHDPQGFTQHLEHLPTDPIGTLEPRIVLYQSRLLFDGAHYTVLKEWCI